MIIERSTERLHVYRQLRLLSQQGTQYRLGIKMTQVTTQCTVLQPWEWGRGKTIQTDTRTEQIGAFLSEVEGRNLVLRI